MKLAALTLILSMLLSTGVLANTETTENFCSQNNPQICAHIKTEKPFSTKSEGQFVLHVLDQATVSDLKINLWMDMGGHGHGSSPVEIKNLAENKFQVTNAWFVMRGRWLINISFTSGGQLQEISIPVLVTQ